MFFLLQRSLKLLRLGQRLLIIIIIIPFWIILRRLVLRLLLRLPPNVIGIVNLLLLLLLLDWNKLLLQLWRLLFSLLINFFFISPSLPLSYFSFLFLSSIGHSKVKPAKWAAHINIQPTCDAFIMEMM